MDGKPEVLIERLHVDGFGCIRDQTVNLGPLTVLIGPNDSGKSMVLRALGQLAAALDQLLPEERVHASSLKSELRATPALAAVRQIIGS